MLNTELRIPVRGVLGAVAFVDAGNVFRTVNEMDFSRVAGGRWLRSALSIAGRPDSRGLGNQTGSESAADRSEGTANGAAYQSRTGILMAKEQEKGREQCHACLSLGSVLFLALGSFTARAEIIDRVLAILPGQIITQSDVHAALDLGLVERARAAIAWLPDCRRVIDRVLMLNEVRRVVPPEPSEAAIEARVAADPAAFRFSSRARASACRERDR